MTPFLDATTPDQGAELASRIHAGDRRAESEFARLYCDCVLAMALARTRDREAARELADDVLMAVIVALRNGTVRDGRRLGGFVHGTAFNLISSHQRRRRHRPREIHLEADCMLADPNDALAVEERRAWVSSAMRLLDPRDRRILELCLVDGLKPGEIAARLQLPPAVVRQRKCRALRALVIAASDGAQPYEARGMLQR